MTKLHLRNHITCALVSSLALTACSQKSADIPLKGEASPYLFVFAGDQDTDDADFMTMINVNPASETRGNPISSVSICHKDSMPHHMEFMHDVRVANWKHEMTIYRHDCVKVNSICASLGHGAVHDYEPPLLFYHDGEWSESFHDDIQTGKAPKPTTRQERVQSMIRWIDNASPSAANKLFEREQMFAKMRHEGSPMQKYMREIHKKEAEKNKDGAAKGSEEAKVEL